MSYSYPLSASLEQLRGQERRHPVSNCNTFSFNKHLRNPYAHKICINTYLPLLHREHSIIVNSVARVAVVKVAAARVAEVVKEVGVAGPHRHHLEMDALIGRIA